MTAVIVVVIQIQNKPLVQVVDKDMFSLDPGRVIPKIRIEYGVHIQE
jgi:hypothetical protein